MAVILGIQYENEKTEKSGGKEKQKQKQLCAKNVSLRCKIPTSKLAMILLTLRKIIKLNSVLILFLQI